MILLNEANKLKDSLENGGHVVKKLINELHNSLLVFPITARIIKLVRKLTKLLQGGRGIGIVREAGNDTSKATDTISTGKGVS